MSALPSGTVTLLFSDVEGSTMLLSRLGSAYAEALDGQRSVLRAAWTAHAGIELGTEGDSFFVAFPTAGAAVSAATQAQRDLGTYPWPGDEPVRVRVGIHTGSPAIHDGGYVGMDVHRAARIAASAHGGQVVLSASTAELVGGSLPDGVRLQDLGAHQLKDIALPEHLYQLRIAGLPAEFPPLRSLGAALSLPAAPTPLVGRDGELAELVAELQTTGVRLVTLTGPGGSGKTRLAIAVAEGLVEAFPDGVYFVPLATTTTADVMWTTIAETLDVAPEGRTPQGLLAHVAHRRVLLVLDNLEQLVGADSVVAALLAQTQRVVVIATSRRPLHLPAEHEHAVPPLELPAGATFDAVAESGAVQLFVQQARRVRSAFGLTPDNAGDVAAVCQRLDGLPLALELAAARSKLLSPRALLVRLDTALDMAVSGSQVPSRQRTLRDTIAWSYDLLTPDRRRNFCRLGVFAGGADLEAIAAVTGAGDVDLHGDRGGAASLDLVGDLVDASLLTVTEAPDGEPRIGMLATVRAYAVDRLASSGESEQVRHAHAQHYLMVAERLSPLISGAQHVAVRSRFATEHENLRVALGWAVQPGVTTGAAGVRVATGLRLCVALERFWRVGGYFSEGRRWLERAVEHAGSRDSVELARCLQLLAEHTLVDLGDPDRAHAWATASVSMWRRLDDTSRLPRALSALGSIELERQRPAAARPLYEEALRLVRKAADREQLRQVLGFCATLEGIERNYQQSIDLDAEALSIAHELGDAEHVLYHRHTMACTMRESGRFEEARQSFSDLVPQALELNQPVTLIALAEDYAAALAALGNFRPAVRLLGAAEAMRDRLGLPRLHVQEAEIAEPIAETRAALPDQVWNDAYQAGRQTTVEDALSDARNDR